MEQISKNNKLNDLIIKLNNDKSLMQKFYDLENPTIDDLYSIALSISDGYSKEEFIDFLKCIKNKNSDNILNNSDLNQVSGGVTAETILDGTVNFINTLYPVIKKFVD